MGRKARESVAPQIHGAAPAPIQHDEPTPKNGLWFMVLRDLERNGVHYFALSHHLMRAGEVPARVPSMGAKGKAVGDTEVPSDKTGMIDLSDALPGEIWSLCENGTVRPVEPLRVEKLLEEGKRATASVVPALIPPMRRITPAGQYDVATNVPLTSEGAMHQAGEADRAYAAANSRFVDR